MPALARLPDPPFLAPERPRDRRLVEGLIVRAFGPGRFAKTAERLRETSAPILDLSFVAWCEGEAVGCVRLWPILIGEMPALLLGPFAVEEAWRSQGLGAALIRRAVKAATSAGHDIILLVGDQPFFGQLGFSPARDVVLPGPVDPRRVLVRALRPGAADQLSGLAVAVPA
jgi:predicted N-acetyltransferase YhbS